MIIMKKKKKQNIMRWHKVFIILPRKLKDGRIAFMCTVKRRWNNDLNPWAYYEYSGLDGGWDYKQCEQRP